VLYRNRYISKFVYLLHRKVEDIFFV